MCNVFINFSPGLYPADRHRHWRPNGLCEALALPIDSRRLRAVRLSRTWRQCEQLPHQAAVRVVLLEQLATLQLVEHLPIFTGCTRGQPQLNTALSEGDNMASLAVACSATDNSCHEERYQCSRIQSASACCPTPGVLLELVRHLQHNLLQPLSAASLAVSARRRPRRASTSRLR